MDIHLRHLRYFVAVAEELHFTLAAQRLFVSQPALSKQLRVLERELGCELLERGPRGVTLTAAGEALLPLAKATLDAWHAAEQAVRAAGRGEELVVGMQTAVGRGLQRRAMRRLAETMPRCRVTLRVVDWTDPTAGLADGTSDVAFLWQPMPAGLSARTLVRERRVVAMAADHPLATRQHVGFDELADEPFVALPDAAGPIRDYWLACDVRDDRPPVIGAVAATADEALEAVTANAGVVLLAEGNAELYRRPGLAVRPVADLADAELAIAWRTGDSRPAVAEFVAAVSDGPQAQTSGVDFAAQ